MPHIVFDKKVDLGLFSSKFSPLFIKEPHIVKLNDFFLNRDKNSALVSVVVIDEKNQQFLIEILAKEEKTTIRLFPGTDPEKTSGVKLSLGCVARLMQNIFQDINVSKSNIAQFIPESI